MKKTQTTQYKEAQTLDVSNNMTPNATPTSDKQDRGGDTPGVSDDVNRLSLAEETINEQRMEVDEEEEAASKEKKTRRTQPSRRKRK